MGVLRARQSKGERCRYVVDAASDRLSSRGSGTLVDVDRLLTLRYAWRSSLPHRRVFRRSDITLPTRRCGYGRGGVLRIDY